MDHAPSSFLQDLASVIIVAGVVTVIFHLLRQPVVLGYIIAGVIVGPHTPGILLRVEHQETVQIMSELGMILLMFSLGLHFSLRKLAQVGATAFIAASLEIVVMVSLGYGIGKAFGWSRMDSLFLGAILAISSTTIIIKALTELGMAKKHFAQLIFGVLIVEDILGIAMIALLSGIAKTGGLAVGEVGLTLGKLGIFLASVLVGGLLLVPPLLRFVNRFKSNEMLLVATLGLCFGVSLLALSMEYSVALGAFLIGAIVAEAREKGKIEVLIEPVRDLFSAIFFVAIGMLIEPQMLLIYWKPILVITIAVVIGKVIACSLGTLLAGHSARTSMHVGMGLSQIGEFSFIIAAMGQTLHVTSAFLYPIAVTVSAITTLLTPYLIRAADPTTEFLARMMPRRIANASDLYTKWVAKLGTSCTTGHGQVRRFLRRWTLQIGLNMALVSGIFLAATAVHRRSEAWGIHLPTVLGGSKTVIWTGAMILSLPLIIVSHRKVRAISLVAAEASVPGPTTNEHTQAMRTFISAAIRVAWSCVATVYMLLIGAGILPPWPVLVVLLFVLLVIAIWRWRTFENVYAKAQLSLRDTLSQPEQSHASEEALQSFASSLNEAELQTVQIGELSSARGKLIRELQLRTRSGASAVGIERGGASVINPGPDEELQAGDKVLLLGSSTQLSAARTLLGAV